MKNILYRKIYETFNFPYLDLHAFSIIYVQHTYDNIYRDLCAT